MIRILVLATVSILLTGMGYADDANSVLMDHDTRGRVVRVREMMQDEIACNARFDKEVQSVEASFYTIARLKDGEKKLEEFIALRRRIVVLIAEIKSRSERQIEINGMSEAILATGGIIPQMQTYLEEVKAQLQSFGTSQEEAVKKLQKTIDYIGVAARNVQAPATYSTASGIKFTLVSYGPRSFYISMKPIAKGFSLDDAFMMANDLTTKEGFRYYLPTQNEINVLKQAGFKTQGAMLTIQQWATDNPDEMSMSERFGVRKYLVWDPENILGFGETFGEVPFAKYDEAAIYFVTPARTGWQIRWNKIAAEMR